MSLTLYPAWRQALSDLLAAGLTDGQVITDDWLCEAFGLRQPQTIQEAKEHQGKFNFFAGHLAEALLRDHSIMIVRLPGVGYSVVPPHEQTKVSMENGAAEILRAYSRTALRVRHVRTDLLDDGQRKENSDAAAKLGVLGALLTKRLGGSANAA
jgi:hypothetical protein